MALEVNTGINPITDVKYNGSALTEQDIADASATGCSNKSFVLYIKAEDVVETPKTFTLSTDGKDDITITIKIA